MLLVYDRSWAAVRLYDILHDGVPVVEYFNLRVVEQVPRLFVWTQLRLHPHECEVVVTRIKDKALEFVYRDVCLWVVKTAQLEDAWDEEKRWE